MHLDRYIDTLERTSIVICTHIVLYCTALYCTVLKACAILYQTYFQPKSQAAIFLPLSLSHTISFSLVCLPGHCPHDEAPEATDTAIQNFMKSI